MSRQSGVVYCDFIRCHLVIAPGDRGQLNFVRSDYHGACFLAENREKQAAGKPSLPRQKENAA